jgi:hypothetical protein
MDFAEVLKNRGLFALASVKSMRLTYSRLNVRTKLSAMP